MTSVIETCGVAPPTDVAADLSVPLSVFDLIFVHHHPSNRLIFYDHSCSDAEFFNSIVPKLKQSLSLTLKYYLPVAGNLLYPSDIDKNHPLIRYISGNTVPMIIAVSSRDFDELTGNHARDSDQFYNFIPEMPPLRDDGEYKLVPLIALQATLFPGRGICIGISNHHCLGDARSMAGFMWAWAEINKYDGDEEFLSRNSESLPLFDRSVLGDCSRLKNMYWNATKNIPLKPYSFPLPTDRVRASFTLHQSHIQNLKNLVLSKKHPDLAHVSSFVVTVAYVWSCWVKSSGEEAGGDEAELFICPADGRGRPNSLVNPPVPVNYFGNFIVSAMVKVEHKKVAADDGFVAAAAAISDQIKDQINNKDNFLNFSDNQLSEPRKKMNRKAVGVAGSPKFDVSNADFGWGKGRRVELVSLDATDNFVSLYSSDDGLVVGLSLPSKRMEAFAAAFENGLNL